ncbi:hypothetical protein [Aurantimonas sp. 22II-16-19i]|uniref:hypothetical protein n=1 Tax=Aurantimonas sp. 22II-16-19i TaxID=1317114 RepID=UPI0009F7B267|nr:hypothetical protein [Aurantimonas sp. 22II-16-19i]ORE89734.1 hypothetical protein ATO4_23687 [Aurantimonas sp. 22II-16-19i]
MSKRFVAGATGVKVSGPGGDVDVVPPYSLLFSSERYALSGALRGSFVASQSQDVGDNQGTVAIDLPLGSGAPVYWSWSFDTVDGTPGPGLPARFDDVNNQLVFTLTRSSTSINHYLIYRNRL